MKTREPENLSDIVREIVPAVLEGDWLRCADETGERYYYIIRSQDHDAEVQQSRAFTQTLSFGSINPDAFEDWYIRSALAEEPPDRLAKARRRAANAGVDAAWFDTVVEAAKTTRSVDELRQVLDDPVRRLVQDGAFDALAALLEAVRIERVRQGEVFVSERDRPELHWALEAHFLKELSQRFSKVVRRAARFDWLAFSDPQMREASRCFLYGFFRAAVLTAAAGLEQRLKTLAVVDRLESYETVVDLVFGKAGIAGRDQAKAAALKDLFKLRNEVAHGALEPTAEQAQSAVDLVRETLELLARRFQGIP